MLDFDKLNILDSAREVSDELLAAYIDGNTTEEENLFVEQHIPTEEIDTIMETTEDSQSFQDYISVWDGDYGFWELGLPPVLTHDGEINNLNNNDMYKDSIIGDVTPFPGSESCDIIQQQNDTCAIKSQQIVLHSFGIDIPESTLTEEAIQRGYYVPGEGSDASLVGELLEDHNVGYHRRDNATVYDLVNELAQGHKVIVGVDADELWRPSFFNDLFGEQANHALIVTGIDTSDPNDIRVIITDPGTGDVARSYPISQFMDAWSDSSCMMVATDQAPALAYDNGTYNHEMINFDYSEGHIPYVGHIPYDVFADTMVPQFGDYFNQHLGNLLSPSDFDNLFTHMEQTFNSCNDWALQNNLDVEDSNFDDMFNDIFFNEL